MKLTKEQFAVIRAALECYYQSSVDCLQDSDFLPKKSIVKINAELDTMEGLDKQLKLKLKLADLRR